MAIKLFFQFLNSDGQPLSIKIETRIKERCNEGVEYYKLKRKK
jgi:hypothetical protein